MCVIVVCDDNDSVDNSVHDQIKQLVRQSVLMRFRLKFRNGSLYDSDDGLYLIKD